jgi:hypothetical protein
VVTGKRKVARSGRACVPANVVGPERACHGDCGRDAPRRRIARAPKPEGCHEGNGQKDGADEKDVEREALRYQGRKIEIARLFRETLQELQESTAIDDGDSMVLADVDEGTIASDDVVKLLGRRAAQQVVVVWIAAHAGRGRIGEDNSLGVNQCEQGLPIARSHGILCCDLWTTQDLGDLVGPDRGRQRAGTRGGATRRRYVLELLAC